MKFFDKFLCIVSTVSMKFFEFVTERSKISDYMTRDMNGTISQVIRGMIISIFLIIFVVPMLMLARHSQIE